MKRCPYVGSGEAEPGSAPVGIKGWERDNYWCCAMEGWSWERPCCPRPVLGPEPLVILIGCRGKKKYLSVGCKNSSPDGGQGGGLSLCGVTQEPHGIPRDSGLVVWRCPMDAILHPEGWEVAPEGFTLQPSAGSWHVLAGTAPRRDAGGCCHPSTGPPDLNSFFPLLAFFCSFLLLVTGTSIKPTLTSSGCWDPSHAWAVSCLSLSWEQPSITHTASSCPGEGPGAKRGQELWPAVPDISPAGSPSPLARQAGAGRMRPAVLPHHPACLSPARPSLCPTPVPGVPGHGSRYPSGVEPSVLTASLSGERPPHPSPTGCWWGPPRPRHPHPTALPCRWQGHGDGRAARPRWPLPPPRHWVHLSPTPCQQPWTLCRAWEQQR